MKKTLFTVAMLVMCLMLVAACTKKDDKKEVIEYVTDASGERVTDENGEDVTQKVEIEGTTFEYVTDENGNKVYGEDGEALTETHYIVSVTDADGKKTTSLVNPDNVIETTAGNDKKNTTTKKNGGGSAATTKPETTVLPNDKTLPEGSTAANTERIFETKYKKLFQSNNYVVKMNFAGEMQGQQMNTPVTFAVKEKAIFIEVRAAMVKIQTMYKDGKVYLIFPIVKKYCVSEEDLGSSGDMSGSISDPNAKYVKTTKVTYSGITYICEEYQSNGVRYKYYFSTGAKELKRIEYIDASGESMILNITSVTAGASDSYFTIPSGYKQVDPEELANGLTGLSGLSGNK